VIVEQNQAAFEWIQNRRDEMMGRNSFDRTGNFVSQLVPPAFESYAKVLHRIQSHYEFIDNPLSESEKEVLKISTCEPLRSFVEARRCDPTGTRVRWKQLAELLDVPFAPAINHEWFRRKLEDPWCWARLLWGPNDGRLSDEECLALASVLESVTGNSECFFRFSDIPFYAPVNSGKPQLFRGTLDQVCALQKEKQLSFEYWWPTDQSWCVCSNYDLQFTIVAGDRTLISTLLQDSVLECIEVTPATRVDYSAPMPTT
jgi:hypothetical protein